MQLRVELDVASRVLADQNAVALLYVKLDPLTLVIELSVTDGDDFGFQRFLAGVDVLVMGRKTFEAVRDFDPWLYAETPVVVLSSRELQVPPQLAGRVRREDAPPAELVARLAAGGARHLYVDGGLTVQRFLAAGRVDELTSPGFRSCSAAA